MRIMIGSPRSANYFDRFAIIDQLTYAAAAVAPHADAQRATFTLAAAYRAMVGEIKLAVIRDVVTAGLGIARAYVRYTAAGGVAQNIALAWFNALAVASGDKVHVGAGMVIYPGDQIEIRTEDVSAGGSCTYDCCVTLLRFNA